MSEIILMQDQESKRDRRSSNPYDRRIPWSNRRREYGSDRRRENVGRG